LALFSRLFRGVPALEACLIHDGAHLTVGTRGEHVRLVQRALVLLGDRSIPSGEYVAGLYGPRTAAAVLDYKRRRSIINRSYQTQADNIVGKMTIAALDKDLLVKQDQPSMPNVIGGR
jgi:peptidoglycan hydrolase-like protein with peptidoglycan-binding domain